MREDFIEELIKEVLGPRNGPEEIIHENPANEYLTGILIPSPNNDDFDDKSSMDGDIVNDNRPASSDEYAFDDDNVVNIIPSDLDPTQRARSFGISFVIEPTDPKIDVCITWGRYFKSVDDDGNEFWTRKPCHKVINNIDLDKQSWEIQDEDDEDEEKPLKLYIKKRILQGNKFNIMISLVNNLKDSEEYLDCSRMIFQPSLRIKHNGMLPIMSDENSKTDSLEFVYRNRKIRARGHMCSAIWDKIDYMDQFETDVIWPDGSFFIEKDLIDEKFITPSLRSEFVPMHPIPSPSFNIWENYLDDEELIEVFDQNLLKAKNLSEIWEDEDIDRELCPLIEQYSDWINQNQKSIQRNLPLEFEDISSEIISNQEIALDRMKKGIKILKENENARLAFCFANKAILTQYEWKNGKGECTDETQDYLEIEDFQWRGFQLAFFLMTIESLVEKNSEYRDYLDLLWIATGGGKTESYLAIMAFMISYRRLTNEYYAGTSIFSRYTLRLLTVQQFSRTSSLITAAEYLRVKKSNGKIGWRPKKCDIDKDWLFGSIRFSLGMWVGSAVTPNRLLYKDEKDKYSALTMLMKPSFKSSYGNPAQIVKCPVCGNWLSIQETGIPENDSLFIVVNTNESINAFCEKLKTVDFVKEAKHYNENHKANYFTIKLTFNQIVEIDHLDTLMKYFDNVQVSSLSIYNPGYFGVNKTKGTTKYYFTDFEIFCTNPKCKLNNNVIWKEGHPLKGTEKLDNYYEKNFDEKFSKIPFRYSSRIPVPVNTVDQQIYTKCPTVVIGTVDKIARIAYEGNAATLFGNVSLYNKYYGYFKHENHIPIQILEGYRKDTFEASVDEFLPPDLIIQDELHLIDGPLGSLFGVFEAILSSIIKENGGNPKYIASSATIKNAETQSKLLFARKLYQFPPHGLDVEDNFFVKEKPFKEAWDENSSGRIYMGIYSPGRGPMTPQVRLWSNILNTSLNKKEEKNIKYFWTIVGFYNAIRELGGGIALFREDISERFKHISGKNLDLQNHIELSSRLDSTEVPLELNKIEDDGNIKENQHPKLNAIFTTSMFGTGVDISHLSLMVLNGQPKTTSSYIQASGRIGRSHGGLVVDFLKAGRPRDLGHYEMFPAYHYRFQTSVEPVSVSPFSKGSLDKAVGASIVSFLRNSVNMKFNWDEKIINNLDDDSWEDFDILRGNLKTRLNFIFKGEKNKDDEISKVLSIFEKSFDTWVESSNEKIIEEGVEKDIDYFYVKNPKNNRQRRYVILGDAFHEHSEGFKAIFANAPTSLREVEETTRFWV